MPSFSITAAHTHARSASNGFESALDFVVSYNSFGSGATCDVVQEVNGSTVATSTVATGGSGNFVATCPLATASADKAIATILLVFHTAGGSLITDNYPTGFNTTVFSSPPPAPGRIATVTVTAAAPGSTNIAWSASSGATSYQITGPGAFSATGSSPVTDTTTYPPSTVLTYTVTPIETDGGGTTVGTGTSANGTTGSLPATPDGLTTLTGVDSGATVVLNWTTPTSPDQFLITGPGGLTALGTHRTQSFSGVPLGRPISYTITPQTSNAWGTSSGPTSTYVFGLGDSVGVLMES